MITFFLFSCAMFTLPFVAFFGAKHITTDYILLDNSFTVNVISVFAAVVVVNIIIMAYAFKAFREPGDSTNEKKND